MVKALDLSSQWMNICVGTIPTPGMLLHTIFFGFVSVHLLTPNYDSLSPAWCINEDGQVVKALYVNSNG